MDSIEDISYRVQELTGTCLDRCSIMDNGTMIGSAKCQECKYNNGSNIKMNTIKCKLLYFKQENTKLKERVKELEGKELSACCNAILDNDEQSFLICSNCGDRI